MTLRRVDDERFPPGLTLELVESAGSPSLTVVREWAMDLDSPVLRMCQDGMRAEAEGRPAAARALFRRAWDASRDDYEACVAAHYLARQQSDPEETLYWNREALARADKVGDHRVAAFYPSLHVGVGLAYERLGDPDRARVAFDRAREHLPALPPGEYGDLLRAAITEGLARLRGPQG